MTRTPRSSAAESEMIQGYLDGFRDSRHELPELSNYSPAYVHGWRNGRDDRMRSPRAPAAVLCAIANALIDDEAKK
jgi:ribosome modulation factor